MAAAPVFNLGEKSEIRDFVCKCETGTEKLTCKLGTLFAQTHFYGKHETLAPLLVAKYTKFRCIQQTQTSHIKPETHNSNLASLDPRKLNFVAFEFS